MGKCHLYTDLLHWWEICAQRNIMKFYLTEIERKETHLKTQEKYYTRVCDLIGSHQNTYTTALQLKYFQ